MLTKEVAELRKELADISKENKTKERHLIQDISTKKIIELEKCLFEQEQYPQRECIELDGLPSYIEGEEFEDHVVETFKIASIPVKQQSFFSLFRIKNRKIIPKLTNR